MTRSERAAAKEAHLYHVVIHKKTATHVSARVSRIGEPRRAYSVWLDTDGLIACQCKFNRTHPGQPCRHARYTLAALESSK